MDKPLVSIFMPTYNHAPYISEALDGCLKQKTSFPFEIVVCDDCSVDNTRQIVESYARSHNNIILSFQKRNTRGGKNFMDGLQLLRGKYAAFCEGDDVWFDENKLETQVAFLEAHPDFTVSCHRVKILYDCEMPDPAPQFVYKDCNSSEQRVRDGIFYADEAIANYFFQTSSYVFRWKFPKGFPEWVRQRMCFDHFLFLLHAVDGKIKYFDQPMSGWRHHEGGYTWLQNVDKGLFFQRRGDDWIKTYQEIDKFFNYRFTFQIRERILLALRHIVDNCLKTNQIDQLRSLVMKYKGYFFGLFGKNAIMLDALRLVFPDDKTLILPWVRTGLQDETEPAAPAIGGVHELDISQLPTVQESVWDCWIKDQEYSLFANVNQAIMTWLWQQGTNKVWLPSFYDPLIDWLRGEMQIIPCFYECGSELEPDPSFVRHIARGDAVLTCAWLGKPTPAALQQALHSRAGIYWLEDRRHALAPEPQALADAVAYSPSEVLGVPDGGILVGRNCGGLTPALPAWKGASLEKLLHQPFLRYEGAPFGRAERLAHEMEVQRRTMPASSCSRLTVDILKRLPMKELAEKRRANWATLYEALGDSALWKDPNPSYTPFAFPLVVSGPLSVEAASTILSARGIYCYRYWHPLQASGYNFSESSLLSGRLLLLPCDHRYGKKDMEYVAAEVQNILRGNIDKNIFTEKTKK